MLTPPQTSIRFRQLPALYLRRMFLLLALVSGLVSFFPVIVYVLCRIIRGVVSRLQVSTLRIIDFVPQHEMELSWS